MLDAVLLCCDSAIEQGLDTLPCFATHQRIVLALVRLAVEVKVARVGSFPKDKVQGASQD